MGGYTKLALALGGLMLFCLGWVASGLLNEDDDKSQTIGVDILSAQPRGNDTERTALDQFERLVAPSEEVSRDKPSPQDWIPQDRITVYSDRVVIRLDDPEWSMFTDTKSMDPVIDGTSNAIQLVPKKPEQIKPGDIVAYQSEYHEGTITHRVVETAYDESGWYARIKGDNNENADPGKVRFSQIKRVVVGILY